MDAGDFANVIKLALGFGAFPTSSENAGLTEAIIEEIKMAEFILPLATGTAPSSGGELELGAAVGGLIVPGTLDPVRLAEGIAQKLGKPIPPAVDIIATPQVIAQAAAIVTHLSTCTVTFFPESIEGECTNTPTSPGTFTGSGSGGKILGLVGPVLADLMFDLGATLELPSPTLIPYCTAITLYIMAAAEVTFADATILGTAPAGGGPILPPPAPMGTGGKAE